MFFFNFLLIVLFPAFIHVGSLRFPCESLSVAVCSFADVDDLDDDACVTFDPNDDPWLTWDRDDFSVTSEEPEEPCSDVDRFRDCVADVVAVVVVALAEQDVVRDIEGCEQTNKKKVSFNVLSTLNSIGKYNLP